MNVVNDECASHAYGAPVIAFIKAHPCASLTRTLATTTVGGRAVGFARSFIFFKGGPGERAYAAASGFTALVEKDGTGNLSDLLREGHRLPSGPTSVPSPDAFNAVSQDAGVAVTDAWYLDRPTPDNDPALVQMAQDLFLRFS